MLACPSPGAVRCFCLRSDAVTEMPRFHPFPSPCLTQGRCLCVSHTWEWVGALWVPLRAAMMDVLTHRALPLLSPHPEVMC